jgi:hypothetical protein
MLTDHRKHVHFSLMAFDMALWSEVETAATLYQRDTERFHLVLTEPLIQDEYAVQANVHKSYPDSPQTPRLLWFEIAPRRVIMTMQGNGQFSYRHFWEPGVYGLNRYWLQGDDSMWNNSICLRNYTRSLTWNPQIVEGELLPHHLRLEYELWSNKMRLGHYVLNLEIHH